MYSTYITNDVWTIINVSIILYWYSKKSSKILWSQTEIAVLNIMQYPYYECKLYLLYCTCIGKSMRKDNMYYRPDMGWEPVWYGLWINMAELIKENLRKKIKNLKVLLSLDYQEFQNYFSSRQKRNRTRLALPRFCHFSGPPMQGYTHKQCI